MKKLFVVALAAMAMVSCVMNEEVVEVKGGDAIAFADAFLDNATRAAVDPSFTPNQGENPLTGFNVWAFMDDVTGTVFEAEDVTKSGDAWTYVNTQYWAPNHTYYFAALAPMDSANATVTPSTDVDASKLGLGKVEFTNVDGSEDLVYAKKSVTTAADINQQPAPVKLQFQHLLSKVKFTFENGFTNENATLKITKIQMTAPKTGTIDLAVADYAKGWVLGADEAFAFGDLEVAELGIGAKAESAMERLMIPAAADHKYVITFTAKLYMGDVLAQTFEETTELTGIEFEMGKGYNLTAELNGGNLGLYPITFEVDVTEWDEYTDVTVDPRVVYVSNFTEFQAALDNAAADKGCNIIFAKDIEGDVTLLQKEGVNLVIDGAEYKYDGVITVNGDARAKGQETVTFKNINFEASEKKTFISAPSKVNGRYNYSHNVTIEDCTFTGNYPTAEVGCASFTGTYNLVVRNCEATGVHSLVQAQSCDNTVLVENVKVLASKSGVSFGNTAYPVLRNANIEATEYGVRGDANASRGNLVIEKSTIEAAVPVVIRKVTTAGYAVNLAADATLTKTGTYDVVFTSGDDDAAYVAPTVAFSYNNASANAYTVFGLVTDLAEALANGEKFIVLAANANYAGTYKMANGVTIIGNGAQVGAIELNGANNVTLKDIKFNATTGVVAADYKGDKRGGVYNIVSGSDTNKPQVGARNLVIDGCTFEGTFTNGGAPIVFVDRARPTGGSGNVTIKNCTFNTVSAFYDVYGYYTGNNGMNFVIEKNTFNSTSLQGLPVYLGRYASNNATIVKGNKFNNTDSIENSVYVQAHSGSYTVSIDAADNTFGK